METFRITQVSYSSKFCQYLASIDDSYLIQISSWWLQRWCSSSSTLSIFQIDPWHFTVRRSPPFFVFHSFIGTQSYIVYSLQRLLVLCLNILVPKLFSVWLVGAPSCWFLCPCKVRWGNRNPHTPFMGVENRAATLVNSLTVLQASKHRVSVWPSNSAPWYTYLREKKTYTTQEIVQNVYSSIIHKSHKVQTTQISNWLIG